jgi:sugar phosphate isomerase/epimerase
MKYAYTTLACPAWPVEQMIAAARGFGYSALEFRLLDGEVLDPVADRAKLERAVRLTRAAGLEVCALDTSCRVVYGTAQEQERTGAELAAWIRLARDLDVPLLRVFGGSPAGEGAPPLDDAALDARAAATLRQAAPDAARAGVTLALETHDAYSSARRVAAVLRQVDSVAVGALWDTLHPYRVGEDPAEVLALLGSRLVHVHIKDARCPAGGSNWDLVLLGEGDVPVAQALALLAAAGYRGYLSVEWEKKWHPGIAEPEVAIPQHIDWLRRVAG